MGTEETSLDFFLSTTVSAVVENQI